MNKQQNYKTGEQLMKNFLEMKGYTVKDVSGDSDYWDKDIDLIVNDEFSIEVKWDNKIAETGNLFIETDNSNSYGGEGWINFTEADYLAYGDSQQNRFYIIDMNKLKKYIKEEGKYLLFGETRNSLGRLIPVPHMKKLDMYITTVNVNTIDLVEMINTKIDVMNDGVEQMNHNLDKIIHNFEWLIKAKQLEKEAYDKDARRFRQETN